MATKVRSAAEQIHDALDAADAGFHDRETGSLDLTSDELAAALLASGWLPPGVAAGAAAETQPGRRVAAALGRALG